MAQDYDIVERLEKQIEGSNLALAAVAEVLHKMDSRISKQEDYDMELAENEEDAIEKQEIIKAVAGEVYGLIKADQGMPGLEASERKASGSGKSDKNADDGAEAKEPKHDLKSQQATIQAMQKQLNLLKDEFAKDEYEDIEEENGEEEEDENGEDADEEEAGGQRMGLTHYAVENAAEYPVLEQMQKQINELKDALDGSQDMKKAVQHETEGRLRKMGFREETSLTRPTIIRYEDSMGTDGTSPIQKEASGVDTVDQMMQLSYKDLRRLQETIENGETDGIPRELLG
jgi:hypothetical protein